MDGRRHLLRESWEGFPYIIPLITQSRWGLDITGFLPYSPAVVRQHKEAMMPAFCRVVFVSLVVLLAACSPTKQARSVETTGFLGTLYPLMHKGEEGEALL